MKYFRSFFIFTLFIVSISSLGFADDPKPLSPFMEKLVGKEFGLRGIAILTNNAYKLALKLCKEEKKFMEDIVVDPRVQAINLTEDGHSASGMCPSGLCPAVVSFKDGGDSVIFTLKAGAKPLDRKNEKLLWLEFDLDRQGTALMQKNVPSRLFDDGDDDGSYDDVEKGPLVNIDLKPAESSFEGTISCGKNEEAVIVIIPLRL